MELVGNDMPSLSLEEDVDVTTLVGMHRNENADKWEEFVKNDMDHSIEIQACSRLISPTTINN